MWLDLSRVECSFRGTSDFDDLFLCFCSDLLAYCENRCKWCKWNRFIWIHWIVKVLQFFCVSERQRHRLECNNFLECVASNFFLFQSLFLNRKYISFLRSQKVIESTKKKTHFRSRTTIYTVSVIQRAQIHFSTLIKQLTDGAKTASMADHFII